MPSPPPAGDPREPSRQPPAPAASGGAVPSAPHAPGSVAGSVEPVPYVPALEPGPVIGTIAGTADDRQVQRQAAATGSEPVMRVQPVTIVEPVSPNASAAARFAVRSGSIMRMLMPTIIVIGGVLFALSTGKAILMPVFIATLLAMLLAPLVGWMSRRGVSEGLGALLIVILLVGSLTWVSLRVYQPAQAWVANSQNDLGKLRAKLQVLRKPIDAIQSATTAVDKITEQATGTDTQSATEGSKQRPLVVEQKKDNLLLETAEPVLVGGLTMIVLLYFLLASGDMFLRKLVRVLPTLRDKRKGVDIARGIQDELAHYLRSIGMINLGLGIAVGALCYFVGLPNPLLWGSMVAVLNFVPYIGPFTSLAILTFISLVSLDDVGRALIVPIGFMFITLVEGNFIQPWFIGRRLQLNPVVIFLSVAFWGWLWGIGGVILAVPILVVLRICTQHIPSWNALGEFLANEPETTLGREDPKDKDKDKSDGKNDGAAKAA